MGTINKKIQDLIYALKANPHSFGRTLGLTGQAILNIVGARQSKPSYDMLKKIIEIHNVNPSYLFKDDEPMFIEEHVVEINTVFDVGKMRRVSTLEAESVEEEFKKIWSRLRDLEKTSL